MIGSMPKQTLKDRQEKLLELTKTFCIEKLDDE
jgi:hypothetical protein